METVKFTQMKDGSKEDYLFLREFEHVHNAATGQRIIRELRLQEDETLPGYKITRLGHALQGATRAYREGSDIDWVVGVLLHDIGDGLAPQNHDRFAAEIIRPFMREEVVWTVEHHASFQMYYYAHHYGWNQHEREKYRGSPYFKSCVDFCERWDQSSFDPDYRHESLQFFVPMVEEVFARKAYDPAVTQPGVIKGLPPLA
jgi:predicted HD phosphohydrolase